MATIYLGLGSNLGDRRANIDKSVSLLVDNGISVLKQSTIIETDPVDGPPQNNFLNSVIKAETNLTPKEVLSVIKKIESILKRIRTVTNGPRTIDIDILLYDNISINNSDLIIPHPRMMMRDFVLAPLKEIAPEVFENLQNENNKNN